MRRSGASCAFRYALDLTDEEEAGQPWYLRQLLRRQRRAKISIPRGTNGSHTLRWRKMDSNLYGAFPVK